MFSCWSGVSPKKLYLDEPFFQSFNAPKHIEGLKIYRNDASENFTRPSYFPTVMYLTVLMLSLENFHTS